MWEKVHVSFLGLWALIELIHARRLRTLLPHEKPTIDVSYYITIIRQGECAIKIRI